LTTLNIHRQDGTCPRCGCEFGACINMENEEAPKPGDVTMCLRCTSFYQFGEGLSLQPLDLDSVPQDVQQKLLALRHSRNEQIVGE